MVFVQRRLPLIHVAPHEAVEVIEAESARPAVERADLTRFPVGRVVIFSEPRGGVAVLAEYLGNGPDVFADQAGVTVVPGGGLGNDAVPGGVMIASREESRPRGRAQSRRVKPRVPQSVGGDAVERGSGHLPAERAELPVTRIVNQDENDVGRALRRTDRLRKLRRIAF